MHSGMTGGFFGAIGMTGVQGIRYQTGGQGSTGTGRVPSAAEGTFRATSRRSFLDQIREMLRQV